MAKNFFEQILGLAGIKSPDANGHYDSSVYRDNSNKKHLQNTNLTGVAKYMAKKEQKSEISNLTGVAKYLAKKSQEEQQRIEAEAASQANMTGVAKYLANLEAGNKSRQSQTVTTKKVEPAKPLTGVDKYLTRSKQSTPITAQPKVVAETKAESLEPLTESKENRQAKKSNESAPTSSTKKTSSHLINLASDATQCQAATLKGSRCRRKTSLDIVEKTINKQRYKFAVCNQHNNKEFIPFSELLQ